MAKLESLAEANDVSTVATIARHRRVQPLYVVTGNAGNDFGAAIWKLPMHRIVTECLVDHVLICCVDGNTSTSKSADGKTLRRRSRPGTITLAPSGERALYVLDNPSTVLELYVSPALIRRYCEQHTRSGRNVSLHPLFAATDPWLSGFFRMLQAEIESYGGSGQELDGVLFGQAQQLLLRHLVRAYSDVGDSDSREIEQPKGTYVLRPHLLRRVKDFVRANIAAEMCLSDLAQLVDLSETHFIRAFYGAAGRTPYRYILDERLQAGAVLLRAEQNLSIADVAKSMGFKNQAHFATKFKSRYGVTPSRYRHAADT